MGKTKLKAVTVYFTDHEYKQIKEEADDYEETVSAYIKARLKFTITRRGAPTGNKNRSKQKQSVGKREKSRG